MAKSNLDRTELARVLNANSGDHSFGNGLVSARAQHGGIVDVSPKQSSTQRQTTRNRAGLGVSQ